MRVKAIMTALITAASLLLAGCNTFYGMGRDIERGGEKIQDGAKTTQQNM